MTKTTNKKAVAAGLTAGLLGGAAAGMVFGIPGVTGAASPSVVQQEDGDTGTDPESADETVTEDRRAAAVERLRDALQPLVDDDTIGADQADDVADFLVDEAEGRFGRMGGKGHMGSRGGGFGNFEVIEQALGMEAAEIREALADGSTLADLAADPQALIDALVAEAQTRLDDAVADGRISEEDAAEREAEMVERVTDMVNGEFERGDVGSPRGPGRWGGPADVGSADEEG